MTLARLGAACRKDARIVVGLMSGTSADGIGACVARITGSGAGTRAETLAFETTPYAPEVRAAVLGLHAACVADLARWNMRLGELFAEAALRALARAGLRSADADFIGSHGQTVLHLPREATVQIAEPAVIAERTGLPVVADFRPRDIAAGGEGAPLVPWVDWLTLRRADGRTRLALNLGGVANVTLVTADPAGVVAFDTGPANGPIDAAAGLVSGGALRFDDGGRLAAAGHVHADVVRTLLDGDPYFARRPPKSASRETWGELAVAAIAARDRRLGGADLVATLTEFVARSVADACERFLPVDGIADVVVSGGGVHNPVLLGRIAALLGPRPVVSTATLGIDPDAREALAFAVLANETVHGLAANLPRVTGARHPVVLGTIVPGAAGPPGPGR